MFELTTKMACYIRAKLARRYPFELLQFGEVRLEARARYVCHHEIHGDIIRQRQLLQGAVLQTKEIAILGDLGATSDS